MSSIQVRAKGREGQRLFRHVLLERDWTVTQTSSGVSCEDIVAVDPDGVTWSVEVKKCRNLLLEHREQARRQAKSKRLRWMLASHIHDTRSWLVLRQGKTPVVWHERNDEGFTDEEG